MSRRGVICLLSFLQRLLGNNNAKEIKKMRAIADHINEIEPNYIKLSDANLVAKTDEFKRRLQKGETLDDLLPEAFAVVREASKRVLGMRHFDVQLMGGICLHNGNIAEMRTGEGKTLVATLPVYLNALTGKGVHVVTVNDYLATRDSEQMGRLYNFLGLSTGLIVANLDFNQRKEAYACDITYGTNNEFGFDYLRDNMVTDVVQMVQRPLNYAIVDEVDSILIDEARTPLIISGPGQRSTDNYYKLAKIVPHLVKDEDYVIDEKQKTIAPTDSGIAKVEKMLGVENLYDAENIELNHLLGASLRAYAMMHRDTDYVVKDGEVVIVDEFTGRLMFGRRYSDGLHQAIEAKEGLKVERESQTLASVTFQNYFRMYDKLSGMTGTAKTEEKEFIDIYGLEVIPIPPNKPLIRMDLPDQIFKTKAAKYRAVVRNAVERHQIGQPILIGTTSITQSEELSDMLLRAGVPHKVLNAKHHEQEAEIVAAAGQMGMVTIATNMAGRGTDITLGEGVPELGGLAILGTERHESRRIDNQLRGRSGRQGDPGESQFYLSLEDELMRRFGSERIKAVLDRFKLSEEESVIKSKMFTRQVEAAQKRVEGNNYDTRKQVLQYDDVMREQREIIYAERHDVITANRDLAPEIHAMIKRTIDRFVDGNSRAPQEEKLDSILYFAKYNLVPEESISLSDLQGLSDEEIKANLYERALEVYNSQIAKLRDEEAVREFQKVLILRVVDNKWTDHIDALDQLRNAVGLRGYAQNNPVVEYQSESFRMFNDMIGSIEFDVTRLMMKAQIHEQERPRTEHNIVTTATRNISAQESDLPADVDLAKVGRNELCPCGSGKKFKHCCGGLL